MLTKSQIKAINKLQQKKYRKLERRFIAEGKKVIAELLKSDLELDALYTSCFSQENNALEHFITAQELKKISALATPQFALAVFKIPDPKPINNSQLIVALDDVRDPGNLGTIIRLCDWFGVTDLVCSLKTADCYNPKAVQASMGSLARVNISYVNLPEFIQTHPEESFGAFLEGDIVYKQSFPKKGILVLGNEANGISEMVASHISKKVNIPQFGAPTTESLNVATAAAILLSEFKRTFY